MKDTNRQLIGILVFVSIMVFTNTAVTAFMGEPNAEEQSLPGTTTSQSDSLPKRILIPSIGVDANVQHVGLGKSGNMAVPYGYEDVGWYRYGPVPGQLGSAVMDGHVDNGFGSAGVFKRLKDLRQGDIIIYRADDGTTLNFVVESVQSYDSKDVPLEAIFNRTDAARLNLITCAGDWSEIDRSYDKRLVVYSRLE
jgi:sortase A